MAKVVLTCPDGHPILGTIERVYGTASLHSPVTVIDGVLDLDYAGETKIDWDSQETVFEAGERMYECSDFDTWPESELVQVPVEEKEKEKE